MSARVGDSNTDYYDPATYTGQAPAESVGYSNYSDHYNQNYLQSPEADD